MAKPFSIVIPTYKEHDNIDPLVQRLGDELHGRQYEILFIDDNSRDGIEEAVAELSARYPARIVVRKDVKGLATAVMDGFDLARYDTILVMDADLQHPPEIAPLLVDAIEKGADVAVASRYVAGGGNVGWNKLRQIISKGAIIMAHLLLPLSRNVKDPMSGFFAFRRELIKNVKLAPIGYKILLELIVIARPRTVAEVPFMFRTREKGKSKLNLGQELEYIRHLVSLMRRSGEVSRFIKFTVVGLSGVIVNEGSRLILTRFGGLAYPRDWIAAIIGIEVSILTNYLLNNYITFADCRIPGLKSFFNRMVKFNLISLVGAGIQFGTYVTLTRYVGFSQRPFDTVANLIGIVLAMLWNFLSNNWWTWKR